MKRRNGDCGKSRKALKRNKSATEGIYWRYMITTGHNVLLIVETKLVIIYCSSSVHYLKLFGIWLVLILLDYLLHFRFEYVWPFWLLFHKIVEGIKHQGFVSIHLDDVQIILFCVRLFYLLITVEGNNYYTIIHSERFSLFLIVCILNQLEVILSFNNCIGSLNFL